MTRGIEDGELGPGGQDLETLPQPLGMRGEELVGRAVITPGEGDARVEATRADAAW